MALPAVMNGEEERGLYLSDTKSILRQETLSSVDTPVVDTPEGSPLFRSGALFSGSPRLMSSSQKLQGCQQDCGLFKHRVDLCVGILGVTITRITECRYSD